jgi:multicomponent Na+:H+ antiporter subunit G
VALCLIGTLGVLVIPDTMTRLHYLTPVTSVGAPLVALAIVVDTGPSRAAVKVLLVAALVALAGPAVSSATARVAAQRAGLVPPEEPS